MTVVQINAVNRYGSTGSNTYDLHNYLIAHGHKSYVFCTNEQNLSDNILSIGNKFDHKVHALLSRISGLQGYYSKLSTAKLIRHLEAIKPDIVLLGNLHGNYINMPLLFKYLSASKVAVVNVLHDCWSFTGHCCHYTKISCNKWKSQCYDCPLQHEDNISYLDRSKKAFTDKKKYFHSLKNLGVIGVSNWIKEEAQQSPIFPSHTRFLTIYNWINQELFTPVDKREARHRLGLNADSFYAISVSRVWNDAKGYSSILNLARTRPNAFFLLVGEKPKSENIPSNVIFTGIISNPQMLSTYYSASDVYLNFSKQETFGKVSAEAMCCGLPVISSNSTASPEVIGECGAIVDISHPEEISRIFDLFVTGEIDIKHEQCEHRVHQLFNKESNLERYTSFFEELVLQNAK